MFKEVEKVVAYITRSIGNRTQVLVFEHQDRPEAGIQVPAGTVEPDESFEDAVFREVLEETGIKIKETPKLLGRFKWFRADRNEFHLRNVFHLKFDQPFKEEWLHQVSGHGEDNKMIFRFYWLDRAKAVNTLELDQGKYLHLLWTILNPCSSNEKFVTLAQDQSSLVQNTCPRLPFACSAIRKSVWSDIKK